MRGNNSVIESQPLLRDRYARAFKTNDIAKLSAAPTTRRASGMTENSLSPREMHVS